MSRLRARKILFLFCVLFVFALFNTLPKASRIASPPFDFNISHFESSITTFGSRIPGFGLAGEFEEDEEENDELGEEGGRDDSKHRGKVVYMTYLAQSNNEPAEDNDDRYFIATRMLGYQLMHAPATSTNTSIPFHVIVPPSMRQSKREQLRRDGAVVTEVELIEPARWMDNITAPRYRNQFTKLRIFEMEEWDRILYIDSDMLVTRRLDRIFHEVEATTLQYNQNKTLEIKDDETEQPCSYLMAPAGDLHSYKHDWPPPAIGELNGGFFLIKPSKELFKYYMSIMKLPMRFRAQYAEQALLNYAHRPGGNLPFKQLHYRWNCLLPNANDFEEAHRAATIHEKWWSKKPPKDIREAFAQVKEDMWSMYNVTDWGRAQLP